jgi:hypothetical protein
MTQRDILHLASLFRYLRDSEEISHTSGLLWNSRRDDVRTFLHNDGAGRGMHSVANGEAPHARLSITKGLVAIPKRSQPRRHDERHETFT